MNSINPRRRPRAAVILPIVALLAAAGAAVATTPAAAAKACKPGSVRATVMGKSTCIKTGTLRTRVPTGSRAAVERRATRLMDSPAFRRALGGHDRYVLRLTPKTARARARVAALARAAVRTPPAARKAPSDASAARQPSAVATQVQPLTNMPGWTGHTTLRSWNLSEAVADFGARSETVAEREEKGARARVVRRHDKGGTFDRCPDPSGTVRGTWTWALGDTTLGVGAEGSGAETGVLQEGTATITVHVADDASIVSYDLEYIHVVRVTTREFQGGKPRHHPTRSYRGRIVFQGLEPGQANLRALLNETYVTQLGMWGPKGRQAPSAQDEAWKSFFTILSFVLGDVQEPMAAVQRGWDQRAECLSTEFTPGGRDDARLSELAEGSSQAVTARVLDTAGREVALPVQTWATENLAVNTKQLNLPGSFTINAIKAGKDGRVGLEGVSKRGRVRASLGVPVAAKAAQAIRYRVLSASFEDSTVASDRYEATGSCKVAGLPIGGKGVFIGSSNTAAEAEGSLMPRSDGSWKGTMATRMPARITGIELTGCKHDASLNLVPCTVSRPDDVPRPNGTWGMGIYMTIPAGAAYGKLTLKAWNPSVGYLEADDDVCNVVPIEQTVPDELRTVELETSKLLGTEPFTVNITGGKSWTTDNQGFPAKIDFTWDYWITLQRIP